MDDGDGVRLFDHQLYFITNNVRYVCGVIAIAGGLRMPLLSPALTINHAYIVYRW